MKKVIVIIAVIVVLGIAGAAFFLLTGGDNDDWEEPVIRVPHEIGQFVSNVHDSRAMLRTSITLVANTEDPAVAIRLAQESARVRHTILMTELRGLTEGDIQLLDQENLERRILNRINEVLGFDNAVFVEVLFTEFVMA